MTGGFMFATCYRHMALRFLKQVYPNYVVEDAPESAGPLLDLVEKDIVRVQDPSYHRPAQIVPGTHWSEQNREAIVAICREFHERTLASPKNEEVSH